MSVESDFPEVDVISDIYDVQPATDTEIQKLETFIENANIETDLTISAGMLMSLLKRIKTSKE